MLIEFDLYGNVLQQLIFGICIALLFYFSTKSKLATFGFTKTKVPTKNLDDILVRRELPPIVEQPKKLTEIRENDHVGNYRIGKLLCAGSFGKVFIGNTVGKTKNAAATVALKFANTKHDISDDLISNEIEILVKIRANPSSQANLLLMYEHFEHEGALVFVMERLDIDLFDYMKIVNDWKPMDTQTVANIAKQLFQANVALLDLGIIHSDIKLENMMVVDRSAANLQIKLIDYGCAVSRKEPELLEYCTIRYSAPEFALGLPLCEKMDSWSLGVVLFEIYTGLRLFRGCQFDPIIRQHHQITGLPDNYLEGRDVCLYFGKQKHRKNKLSKSAKQQEKLQSDWKHRGFKKLFKYSKSGLARQSATVEDDIICKLVEKLLHRNPSSRLSSYDSLEYFNQ